MHAQSGDPGRHHHTFLGTRHQRNERRMWLVVALTVATMGIEILGGTWFGSMALVADGWHMSTHAAALSIGGFAYWFARRYAHDPRFTFGTGKLGELAGFASAVGLMLVALMIGFESAQRLLSPVALHFSEAVAIAVLGLAVNVACAFLLREDHDHDGEHGHGGIRSSGAHRHDANMRAAYLHVLADALTSVMAIVALLAVRFGGWTWMDPVVGIVGALMIAAWSVGLMRSAGANLLDMVPDAALAARIKERLETGGDLVGDLHLWRVGPGHSALVVSLLTDTPREPSVYKARLRGLKGLSHTTVEVQPRDGARIREVPA